jgi:ankyrin repeat protein
MNVDDIDRLSRLDPNVLILMALELDFPELLNLCHSNKTLNTKLCLNKNLWIKKLSHDFGFYYDGKTAKESPDIYYKLLYKNQNKLDLQLINAAKLGYFDIVKYLVDKGANIHAYDENSLILASDGGHLDVVKYLVDNGADVNAGYGDALIYASRNGHLDVVKYLAEMGADIHAEHDSALSFASGEGHLDVVKFLVERGADVNTAEGYPLKAAKERGHTDVVKFLQDKGAEERYRVF